MNRSWMHLADASGETLSRALKCGFTELAEFVLREMHHEGRERAPGPCPGSLLGHEPGRYGVAVGATWNGCSRAPTRSCIKPSRRTPGNGGGDAGVRRRRQRDHRLGHDPLHWCALTGDAELAEVLVAHGAQTNARAPGLGGLTPKAAAMLMGYEELADLLSACGGTC